MPESSSTFTPFEPSPGYGPPVSSGTSTRSPSGAVAVPSVATAVGVTATGAHAASSVATEMPPNRPRAARRFTRVVMS